MPLPSNYVQAFPVLNLAARPSTFVLWYTFDGTPPPTADPDTLAIAIGTQIYVPLQNVMSDDFDIYGVNVRSNVAGVVTDGQNSVSLVGTISSPGLPARNCVVIRKITATGGRTGRGRWFIPGVAGMSCVDSYLTIGAVTVYGVLAAALCTPFASATPWGTLTPVLYDRKNSAFLPIEAYSVDAIVTSLSRRAPRFPVP